MSFFEDASLVLIPSAQKTSKVYSVKPTDGTGDLTFTRSNDTATRVGADGLIEKVRTNLILQSETFSNASWVKDGTTFSGDTLTAGAGTAFKGIYQVQTTQGVQVNYFDVAYVNHQWVQILVGTSGSDLGYANFDIQNKVVGSFSGIISASIQDFGTYARIVYAINTTNKTATNIIFVDSGSAGRAASTSSTGSFKLLRAQVETGDIATDYIATTSAAVSVGMLANVPRLDYLGGGCPKLILEPQRVNLQLNSEDFSQANWSKTNTTIVVNQLASPDGYVNADKLNETAVNNIHQLESTRSVVAATQYTMSVFAKKAERSIVRVYEDTTNNGSYFDLNNGTLLTQTGPTVSSKIENYGNGWYRCSVTYTETNTSGRYRILVTNADNVTSYLGVAGNGIYIYGAQYEAGSYATSYIPTLGAAVTRGADAASKTGISSLIGQTEGTLFVEFDFNGNYDTNGIVAIDVLGAGGNEAYIFITGGGQLRLELYVASAIQGLILSSIGAVGRKKIAFAYKANDFVGYMNGVQIGTDTSGSVGAMDTIYVGTYQAPTYAAGNINQTLLFKTRLTNAQLAELTTI